MKALCRHVKQNKSRGGDIYIYDFKYIYIYIIIYGGEYYWGEGGWWPPAGTIYIYILFIYINI